MNAWYKFILNVLFSKKSENKDWEMTDEGEKNDELNFTYPVFYKTLSRTRHEYVV